MDGMAIVSRHSVGRCVIGKAETTVQMLLCLYNLLNDQLQSHQLHGVEGFPLLW